MFLKVAVEGDAEVAVVDAEVAQTEDGEPQKTATGRTPSLNLSVNSSLVASAMRLQMKVSRNILANGERLLMSSS